MSTPSDDTTQRIDSDLTIAHAAHLRETLIDWLAAGTAVLDLAAVGECDAAGIQLLCAAQRTALSQGQTLAIHGTSTAVRDALRTCGLDEQLQPLTH